MGLEVLVPLLMGALLQVVASAGAGVLGAVEDSAKDGASGVFAKIKSWWSSDSTASEDLARFEAEPEVYKPVVQARLVKKLTSEPWMRDELAAMLEKAGPAVKVYQNIAEAHGVTGAKVEEMVAGLLRVDQDVQEASNVIGVDIRRMG